MSHAILIGMPEDLANQLTRVLRKDAHQVTRRQSFQDARLRLGADVAFLSGDHADFLRGLSILRESDPHLPVVVVTRMTETTCWLDALEAGARDYCGAPFESAQVRWIMDSVCSPAKLRAAA